MGALYPHALLTDIPGQRRHYNGGCRDLDLGVLPRGVIHTVRLTKGTLVIMTRPDIESFMGAGGRVFWLFRVLSGVKRAGRSGLEPFSKRVLLGFRVAE